MALTNWKESPAFAGLYSLSLLQSLGEDDWGNDRFHLSDASSCSRRIWYRILLAKDPSFAEEINYIPEPRDLQFEITMMMGHSMHALLQKLLVENMHWCTWDDIEVPIEVPEINLKGHVDAVIPVSRIADVCDLLGVPYASAPRYRGTHVVLDFKSKKDEVKSTKAFGKEKVSEHTFPAEIMKYPDMKYFVQLQSYMHLLPEQYPERYPDIQHGILLYVCKNDGRLHTVAIDKDQTVFPAIEDKAKRVLQAVETKTPPPREYARTEKECCGHGRYKACPYFNVCWK